MASEYLKKKYQDVKPDVKRELTPAEKRKNWWHYHKWHVVLCVGLVVILGSIVWNALHQVKPDYQIAYVGTNALPEDTAAAVEGCFAAFGEDLNGDGSVVVRLEQYASSDGTDPQTVMAATVKLMADLEECASYFFLLEDPEGFQQNYFTLSLLDGSLPADGDDSGKGTYLAWEQCPALARTDLGDYSYALLGGTASGSSNELVSGLYIARRGFWTEKDSPYLEGCNALWEKITEGAVS
ncbi:MAG: hypothetical protein HDT15_08415 [Oscillibacter sp.]|nr:hypothetical protein [Oscillibacter sp.]